MEFNYFKSIDDIIAIHSKTVAISGGGSEGIIDLGSIECAIDQIQDD